MSAIGVLPMARNAAYHQTSRIYRVDWGIWAMPVPANWTISPRVWVRWRTTEATLMSSQHVVGVEEGEHGRRVEVFEDLDAHEGGHHRLVDGARHPLGAAFRG